MTRLPLLLTCLIALNVSAQSISEPRLHILDNGLRIITVEDHSAPLVSAVWAAHVGDSAEPGDFTGNSHYLEHLLLFRGTEKYPKNQIGEWAAGRGGYFNGYTWYDFTAFVLMTAVDDLEGVLDRHEQMMFHGAFSGQDFETEKKAVFEELRSGLDTPYGYIWRASSYHMYPEETFYSRSTIGTIETVQAATVERVREYYKSYYVPNNMTLAVVGDFDTYDLLQKIEKRFGIYPAAKIPETMYEPVAMKQGVNVVVEERDLSKAYFLLAVEGPTGNSPEYFPYKVLAEYLSGGKTSVLYSELITNKKVLDSVSMGAYPRRYAKGWQGIDFETESDKAVVAIDALWHEIEGVKQGGISLDELEFAKKRMLKGHWQAKDDINAVAESLAIADANGDYRLFADFEKRLSSVTAADVQTVAKKYLKPSDFFLMSVFPPGEIPQDFAATIKANAKALGRGSSSIASTSLKGGATLLHELKPGAPMESFTAAIRAGGRDGQTAAIAESVANMMVRETAQYSKTELQNLLDKNGFALSASTTRDATYISVRAPSGNSEGAMNLLMDVITNPAFSEREWGNTRTEMMADLESAKDRPSSVAGDLLMSTIYAGTTYGRSTKDELASLQEMSAKDLKWFWKSHYKAKSIAVAYTGAASSSQIQAGLDALNELKGNAALRPAINLSALKGMTHVPQTMAGKTQINLYIAWHAPEIGSDDWILWQLAEKAIGGDLAGRLWKLRQEQGLAYSVWLTGSNSTEQPLTMVYMATAGEKRDAALAAIHHEIKLVQDGLSQAELNRVKVSYLANLNRLDRTSARRSNRHAGWWVSGFDVDRRGQLGEVVSSATLDEVNRVIRQVLKPENYVFVEAGAVPN